MSDEPVSFATRFVASISAKTTRKGMAINAVVTGIILLVLHLIMIAVKSDSFTTTAITPYFNGVVVYAVVSLIAIAHLVVKQTFVTPEVKHVKCNFCGAATSTARLICNNCGSKSDRGDHS